MKNEGTPGAARAFGDVRRIEMAALFKGGCAGKPVDRLGCVARTRRRKWGRRRRFRKPRTTNHEPRTGTPSVPRCQSFITDDFDRIRRVVLRTRVSGSMDVAR